MSKIKLVELIEKPISGEWGLEDENGNGIPVLRTTNFTNTGEIDYSNVVTRDIRKKNITDKYLQKGDIIIEKSGGSDTQPVGRVVYFEDEEEKYLINNFTSILRIGDQSVCFPKYLFYSLFYNYQRGGTIPFQNKTTGLHNLKTNDYINSYEVNLVLFDKQKEIVYLLDKVNHLINLCNNTLEKLDTLVKSRFVEMFGDCNTNSKGLETHKGKDVFKFSSGKFLPEEKRIESGIPVYGGNGIVWYTDYSLIDYPTIIIGRVGAQCGNIHMVNEPVWITDNAIYIKEQKKQFTLEFLSEMMKMMNFYQYADFSGQPKITQKPLESLDYLTPPINLQMEFTDFVNRIIKEKSTVKKSLEKLETLKKSLMQEYFG